MKGERRYHYYVSRRLIKGTATDSAGCGWRLPGPEIERVVAAAAGQILSDRTGIAAAAQAIGLADHRLPSLFAAAAEWRENLQSEIEAGAALNALVDRVDLTDTGIRISLKLRIPDPVTRPAASAHELIITRFFPMTIRRRGVEMRLVIKGNGAPSRRADSALLKAVARARQWSEDLLAGRAQSVAEIAERERVGARYVRRLLRLAFLAPKIVEVIAAGDQPIELTARGLGRTDRSPSALDRASKSRGDRLVGSRSISSSHFRPSPSSNRSRGVSSMEGTASLASRDFGRVWRTNRRKLLFSGAARHANEAAGAGYFGAWAENA